MGKMYSNEYCDFISSRLRDQIKKMKLKIYFKAPILLWLIELDKILGKLQKCQTISSPCYLLSESSFNIVACFCYNILLSFNYYKVLFYFNIRWKNWTIRGIFTIVMIVSFAFMIYLGPLAMVLLVSFKVKINLNFCVLLA